MRERPERKREIERREREEREIERNRKIEAYRQANRQTDRIYKLRFFADVSWHVCIVPVVSVGGADVIRPPNDGVVEEPVRHTVGRVVPVRLTGAPPIVGADGSPRQPLPDPLLSEI